MNNIEILSRIKETLQNTSSEIQIVQKHDNISDLKIEKLNKLLTESENALTKLKSLNISLSPKLENSEIQNLIDAILKVRKQGGLNSSILQLVLSSLQKLNSNLNEIQLNDNDHKRGQKVEKVSNDPLA